MEKRLHGLKQEKDHHWCSVKHIDGWALDWGSTGLRTRQEVEDWKQKCPIKRFKEYLITNNILTNAECVEIEEDAFNQVEAATKFALESPEPDTSKVMEDVFCEN